MYVCGNQETRRESGESGGGGVAMPLPAHHSFETTDVEGAKLVLACSAENDVVLIGVQKESSADFTLSMGENPLQPSMHPIHPPVLLCTCSF